MFEIGMEEVSADEIFKNSEKYMMQLKDLDGWFWPNKNYWRMLQEKYIEACQYIGRLQGIIARSGDARFLADAEAMSKKWHQLNIEFGEYKRQSIEDRAELEQENRRLTYENKFLQQQVDEYERVQRPQNRSDTCRDPKTGRYTKNTSVPDGDKKKKAYLWHTQGWSNSQIAVKLNLSTETVSRYIREIKASREYDSEIQMPKKEQEAIMYPLQDVAGA